MRLKRLLLLATLLITASIGVTAQPINNVDVFSEAEDDDFRRCNLTYDGLIASAKAALRYNRIEISKQMNGDVNLWISGQVLPISNGYCAVSMTAQFYKVGVISLPKGSMMGDHVLCSKTLTGAYYVQNTQSKWNDAIRQMVDLCISKIESKLRK